MSTPIRLVEENTYGFLTEEEAYNFIAEQRESLNVEDSSVKYKKATKKKAEHWIAKVKVRIDEMDNYIAFDEE